MLSMRAPVTFSAPIWISVCVPTTAPANTNSHTASLTPNVPRPNSTAAARKQNWLFCEKMPNETPIRKPNSAAVPPSPRRSIKAEKSMFGSRPQPCTNR